MKGQVVHIHRTRGMVAILTEKDEYSVLELLGDDVSEGDMLWWNEDYPLGRESVRNLTRDQTFDGYFQNHCVPKHQVRRQLLYL